MSHIDELRAIAESLNNNPKDDPTNDWGPINLSSNYLTNRIEESVRPHGKLFRRKKLSFESGLILYIYSYPSYRLFELIRSDPILKECRGLIMSPLGVRSRPFPVIPTIDWEDALIRAKTEDATIKINGMMVTGLVTKEGIVCIGKGGKIIDLPPDYQTKMEMLIRDADILGLTPVFELTDFANPLVLRVPSGCYLVGLRSIRTGRMARTADLIKLAKYYSLDPLTIICPEEMTIQANQIEGVVFNDGETIVRAKTPFFRKLQKITSILRYGRKGDLGELIAEVDRAVLKYNLTTREIDDLKRRQLL